jgi:hypothetical protein
MTILISQMTFYIITFSQLHSGSIHLAFEFARLYRHYICLNSSSLLESALVCPDNNAMLTGEGLCDDVTEYQKGLLSDRMQAGKCKFMDIS